jgi:hypothetical protein
MLARVRVAVVKVDVAKVAFEAVGTCATVRGHLVLARAVVEAWIGVAVVDVKALGTVAFKAFVASAVHMNGAVVAARGVRGAQIVELVSACVVIGQVHHLSRHRKGADHVVRSNHFAVHFVAYLDGIRDVAGVLIHDGEFSGQVEGGFVGSFDKVTVHAPLVG